MKKAEEKEKEELKKVDKQTLVYQLKKIIFRNNYLKVSKEFLKRKESTTLKKFIIIAQIKSKDSFKKNHKTWAIQHYNKL